MTNQISAISKLNTEKVVLMMISLRGLKVFLEDSGSALGDKLKERSEPMLTQIELAVDEYLEII